MALLFRTGFDLTTTVTQLFTGSEPDIVISAGGRNGGNCLTIVHSAFGFPRSVRQSLGTTATTIGVAFAINGTDIGGSSVALISFMDNTTVQATLTLDSDGTLHFTGTSITGTLSFGAYRHLEVWCTIGNSTGSVEVRVDRIPVLSATGIDTQATGNAYATVVGLGLGDSGGSPNIKLDDLHIMDDTGSTYNDFIGDLRVIEQLPTGDGATMQFAPSTGTDGYAMVDEAPPDSDTSYLDDSTVGHAAYFTFPPLPVSTGTVLSVGFVWFGEKTDAGTRTLKASCKSGVTIAHGADIAMPSSYAYSPMGASTDFTTDPNTGNAWTVAGVNAAELGATVVA